MLTPARVEKQRTQVWINEWIQVCVMHIRICVCVCGGGACHREASQSALIWVPLTLRGTPVSAERRLPVLAATQSLPADTWTATVDLVLKLCHYWSTLSPDSLHKKLSCSFFCVRHNDLCIMARTLTTASCFMYSDSSGLMQVCYVFVLF